MTLRTAARGRPMLQWKMRLLSSLPLNKIMKQLRDNLIYARCDGENRVLITYVLCRSGIFKLSFWSCSRTATPSHERGSPVELESTRTWSSYSSGVGYPTTSFPSLSSPASSDNHFLLLRSDFQLPHAQQAFCVCLSVPGFLHLT